MTIHAEDFRRIFGCLPTTVAVITADGHGVTTNTVTAVSQDPPMLSVCLDATSRTLTAVRDSGLFAVNFLAGSGQAISQVFASKAVDKFTGLTHRPAVHAGGAPVFVDDVVAHAECEVHAELPMGDHSIIIGLIHAGTATERPPLMYYRRQYSVWPMAVPA